MVAVFSASLRCPLGFTVLCLFLTTCLLPFSYSESMPQCVANCNRKFGNEAALSRHRKTCSVLEAARQTSHGLRRGLGIRASLQKHSTLLSRKERLQVSGYKLEYPSIHMLLVTLGTPYMFSDCSGLNCCNGGGQSRGDVYGSCRLNGGGQ